MQNKLGFRSALLRCARMISDEINTLLIPHQLNYSLWQIIFVLNEKQGCTSIDMATYLNVSKPSIAKRTQILLKMGIIAQIATSDKRQKKLVLTQHGFKLYQTCADEINRFENRLKLQLNPEDITTSTALLHQLLEIFEAPQRELEHE